MGEQREGRARWVLAVVGALLLAGAWAHGAQALTPNAHPGPPRKPDPAPVGTAAAAAAAGSGADEQATWVRLVDPAGRELLVTGLAIAPGDRFLDPSNRLYEVTRVRHGVARTRLLGGAGGRRGSGLGPAWPEAAWMRWGAWAAGPGRLLAVYHTHSDESFLPDSGVTNRPWNGDIFEVGRVLSLMWRSIGLGVLHSYNRHDPHDGLAYTRSRRTAVELLRQGATALVDVHRDTPPAEVYRRYVNGQTIASVLLVVGRQNPALAANEAFALAIKEYADRSYPQLIRGILYADGDYNQDLHPQALLIEVGSTHNRLEEARQGARLFAAVVPAVLYGIRVDPERMPALPPPQTAYQERAGRAGWRSVALVLVLAVAGGSLYFLLSEDGYERAWRVWTRLRGRAARWLVSLRG